MKSKSGSIYFARSKNNIRVKVGSSNNPERRLKQHRCGNTEELDLIYTFHTKGNRLALEKYIHSILEPLRSIKRSTSDPIKQKEYAKHEVFDLSEEDVKFIRGWWERAKELEEYIEDKFIDDEEYIKRTFPKSRVARELLEE